jgi:hypothetical protein
MKQLASLGSKTHVRRRDEAPAQEDAAALSKLGGDQRLLDAARAGKKATDVPTVMLELDLPMPIVRFAIDEFGHRTARVEPESSIAAEKRKVFTQGAKRLVGDRGNFFESGSCFSYRPLDGADLLRVAKSPYFKKISVNETRWKIVD